MPPIGRSGEIRDGIVDEDHSGFNAARYPLAMFYVGRIDGTAKDDRPFLVIDREQKCDRTEEFLALAK
jgi:hypothetical protein